MVGLAIAVANIDDVINLIRSAPDGNTAKLDLMARDWPAKQVKPLVELLGEISPEGDTYTLSDVQAQAILDLRLQRLTGLEREKIQAEADEISEHIRGLVNILSNRDVLMGMIKDELTEVKEMFDTPRRTVIEASAAEFNIEDFIKPEEMVVTISTGGYVKRQPLADYRAQRRGGKGRSVASMKDDEQISTLFVANTHDPLLVFTSTGKVFRLKVYELPLASSGARGKAFINLLNIEKDERVQQVLTVPREREEWDKLVALFSTRKGLVRKTPLSAFANVHSGGIRGIALQDGDDLVNVVVTGENEGDVLLSSQNGQAVRFPVADLRVIASRTAYGVKGINLSEGDTLVSMDVIRPEETPAILTVTKNGYGKCTKQEDFPARSRGTKGVIAIKTNDRNGDVVASMPVAEDDHVIFVTADGQVIRTRVADVSVIGRNTQGVRLFRANGEVMGATRVSAEALNEDEETDAVDNEADSPEDLVADDSADAQVEKVDGEEAADDES